MKDQSIAGVILCGGQSRRMGGVTKAHQLLAGKPLLQHVIERLAPQVGRVVLSVETISDGFSDFGLEQVEDPKPGHGGPLGGLVAALRSVAEDHEWLLLVPCDAPFLPLNLAKRLCRFAVEAEAEGCVVRYAGSVQPTFSIWNRSLLASLEKAVLEDGMGGFKQYLTVRPQALLDWEKTDISPFFNINDAATLVEAERLLSL